MQLLCTLPCFRWLPVEPPNKAVQIICIHFTDGFQLLNPDCLFPATSEFVVPRMLLLSIEKGWRHENNFQVLIKWNYPLNHLNDFSQAGWGPFKASLVNSLVDWLCCRCQTFICKQIMQHRSLSFVSCLSLFLCFVVFLDELWSAISIKLSWG